MDYSRLPLSPAAAAAAAVLAVVSTGGKPRAVRSKAVVGRPRSGCLPGFPVNRSEDLPPYPALAQHRRRRQRSPSPRHPPADGRNGRARTGHSEEQRWQLVQQQRAGLFRPFGLGDQGSDAATGGKTGERAANNRSGDGGGGGGEWEMGRGGAGPQRADIAGYPAYTEDYDRTKSVGDNNARLSSGGVVDDCPYPAYGRGSSTSTISTSTNTGNGSFEKICDEDGSPFVSRDTAGNRAAPPMAAAAATASGIRGAMPFRCHPESFAGREPFISGRTPDTAAAAVAQDRLPLEFSYPTTTTAGGERGHGTKERHPPVKAVPAVAAAADGSGAKAKGDRCGDGEMGPAEETPATGEPSLLELLGKGALGSHRLIQAAVPLGTTKVPLQIMVSGEIMLLRTNYRW